MLRVKRIYEPPSAKDGHRVLVDRVWPRGVKKADAALDDWPREIAPSAELRRWFGHDPGKWDDFRRRYFEELRGKPDLVAALRRKARDGNVTLLFGARDQARNNAVALRDYLEG